MKHTDDGYTGKSGFKGHDSMREKAEAMFRENMSGMGPMSTGTSGHGPMLGQEGGAKAMKKGGAVMANHKDKETKMHEMKEHMHKQKLKMAAGGVAKMRHKQATKDGSPMEARLAKGASKSAKFGKEITMMSKVR